MTSSENEAGLWVAPLAEDIAWRLSYERAAALSLWRGESAERIVEGIASAREMRFHRARYEYAAHFAPGRRVLDIACGTGYGTQMLSQAGATQASGFDIDGDAIRYASLRYRAPNLSFHQQGADTVPQQGFDMAVSFETIEHVAEPDELLRAVARSLVPDGLCLISTPVREGRFANSSSQSASPARVVA